jgi:hypothetical protein
MRKRFGQALRIGVAADGVALLKTSRWQGEKASVLAQAGFGAAEPLAESVAQALRQLLAGDSWSGWPVTVVLADELLRLWQVTPPAGSTRLADLEAAAALRFQSLYGEPASGWALAAGWDAVHPFLAAAMPRALLAVLAQAAAEHQFTLVEVVPQFVAALNQWRGALKPDDWFGVVHGRVLSLAAVGAHGVGAVRAAALPDDADGAWLLAHLAREALRLNLPAPERLQLCGAVPANWHGHAACKLLGAAHGAGWPASAQLAATGSAA